MNLFLILAAFSCFVLLPNRVLAEDSEEEPEKPVADTDDDTSDDTDSPEAYVQPRSGKISLPPYILRKLNNVDATSVNKNFKSLIFRTKPAFTELLSKNGQKVVEVAGKTFNFQFSSLPVKKTNLLEAESSEELLEIQAFEQLGSIVGKSIRDMLICTASDHLPKACEGIRITNGRPTDNKMAVCTNDENGACKKKKKSSNPLKGMSLDFDINIYGTDRPSDGHKLNLPKDLEHVDLWERGEPTKIILTLVPHEFMRTKDQDKEINLKMIDTYSKRYGVNEMRNIVEIQWPEIWHKKFRSVDIAARLIATAETLADIIVHWIHQGLVQLDKIHIIGFSFGAHLAGMVGKMIKEKMDDNMVARITGLDPIGWGFDDEGDDGQGTDWQLTEDNAEFVDVIHTSSPDNNYPYFHYGTNTNRGTVDFYPNNGRARYCSQTDGLCHHYYSTTLFMASIKKRAVDFVACQCALSWAAFVGKLCFPCKHTVKMGEHINKTESSGVYYLITA